MVAVDCMLLYLVSCHAFSFLSRFRCWHLFSTFFIFWALYVYVAYILNYLCTKEVGIFVLC